MPPQRWDWIAVALVMALCAACKLYFLHPVGPILFFDELIYKQDAESLASLGTYASAQYPLGYPLAIAPAFAFGAGYHGVFLSNVLLTTLLVPACFLLARTVGMRHAWLAALAAALLPLQAVFPTQVLSENLFVPAFAFAAWFAVRGRCASTGGAAIYGVALGGLFLIKYLALPAIPVLWAIWLCGVAGSVDPDRVDWKRAAAASGVAIFAMVAGWLAFVQLSGISVEKASAKISGIHTTQIGPASIFMWACAYLAALCLLAGPFLPLFLTTAGSARRASWTWLRTSPLTRLFALGIALAGICWMVATLHSAGGADNYPVPQRVVVRYFMLLTPLLVVLGLALAFQRELPRSGRVASIAAALVSIGAVVVARAILYHDAIWDFPPWFATIPLYNSDIVGFSSAGMVACLAVVMLVGIPMRLRPLWVAGVMALLLSSTHLADQRAKQSSMIRPIHARTLAPLVIDAIRRDDAAVVVTALNREPPRVMISALVFWGVPRSKLKVLTPAQIETSGLSPTTQVYLVTDQPMHQPAYRQYRYGSRTGYIYLLDAAQIHVAP